MQGTLRRVEDVIELQVHRRGLGSRQRSYHFQGCVEGVTRAVADENYEEACAHVHRYLSFDQTLLRSSLLQTSGTAHEHNSSL